MNGESYTYGSKPHAVTSVGSASYTYDANGNMIQRGDQNITWDWENWPISINSGSGSDDSVAYWKFDTNLETKAYDSAGDKDGIIAAILYSNNENDEHV